MVIVDAYVAQYPVFKTAKHALYLSPWTLHHLDPSGKNSAMLLLMFEYIFTQHIHQSLYLDTQLFSLLNEIHVDETNLPKINYTIQIRVLSIEIRTFSLLRLCALHRCLPPRPRLAHSPDHRQRWITRYK